jgi:symplekin
MAANPVDPLQALGAAIAVTANSKEQADLLATLRESLEAQPGPIPILCTTLFSRLVSAGDSLLRQWFLDLLHFAICRSTLSLEARTQCECLALLGHCVASFLP